MIDSSGATVRRILAAHQLKPWRRQMWLDPKQPRHAAFDATVSALIDLYTRLLHLDTRVLSMDEQTSRQPRPRHASPRRALPQHLPNRYEHEGKRAGALKLLAAFALRSGRVDGCCDDRKCQREFIDLLAALNQEIDEQISMMHLVCDHVSTHHGKAVRPLLAKHPRFVMYVTPGHCSWMNQVEQWPSGPRRIRLRIATFASKDHRRAKLNQFIQVWNQLAHPCNWSTESMAKSMTEAPALAA